MVQGHYLHHTVEKNLDGKILQNITEHMEFHHELLAYSMKVSFRGKYVKHQSDVIISTMVSQITSLTIVYSTIRSSRDQRKHQSSASLALVRRIHRWPANSPHKEPVTRKMLQFDDVIMFICNWETTGVCTDFDSYTLWTYYAKQRLLYLTLFSLIPYQVKITMRVSLWKQIDISASHSFLSKRISSK